MKITKVNKRTCTDLTDDLRKRIETGFDGEDPELLPYKDCVVCYRFIKGDVKHDKVRKGRFKDTRRLIDSAIKDSTKRNPYGRLRTIGLIIVILSLIPLVDYFISSFPLVSIPSDNLYDAINDLIIYNIRPFFLLDNIYATILVFGLVLMIIGKAMNNMIMNEVRLKLMIMAYSHNEDYMGVRRMSRFVRRNSCSDALYYYTVRSKHGEDWKP